MCNESATDSHLASLRVYQQWHHQHSQSPLPSPFPKARASTKEVSRKASREPSKEAMQTQSLDLPFHVGSWSDMNLMTQFHQRNSQPHLLSSGWEWGLSLPLFLLTPYRIWERGVSGLSQWPAGSGQLGHALPAASQLRTQNICLYIFLFSASSIINSWDIRI